MKKHIIRNLALLLLVTMLFSMFATSCDWKDIFGQGGGGVTIDPNEYTIDRIEGHNQLTLYWNKGSFPCDYATCDIWIWYEGGAGMSYPMHECAYGAKVVVNIPEEVKEVGFIVRREVGEADLGGTAWGVATKDYDEDRFAVMEDGDTVIYLKQGDGAQYSSNDGGNTLTEIKLFSLAGMTDFHTIKYNLTPKTRLTSYDDITLWDGDKKLTILNVSSMGKSSSTGLVTVEEDLSLDKVYELEIAGYGRLSVVPTDIFDSEEFAELYHYDGKDLGSYISEDGSSTTFKVWAPTATEVVLNLYEQGHDDETHTGSYKDVAMKRGEKGVWYHTETGAGHGTYYTYTVTTAVGTQVATDPYGKAAGVNGNRTMVVDLDLTDPEGWDDTDFDPGMDSYSDAFIWEVHVRDFSNLIEGSEYKGKYLAFTETGLKNENGVPVGVDYLVNLGVTHVHLLPVYDYATVDEANPDEQFNWGYDPKNYNVPEGSYSTDPYNGEVRIREYKAMVQALHNAGIGVIMDVVYNHTYDKNSSFNRIVPYYYYRYTATGANSSASGCGNDTASERYMYGKFMVESTSYWIEEYNLDGLRFDLMGLHDLETMKEVEAAVHTLNPNAIIYGEGWTMGSTIDGSKQANQTNIKEIKPTNGAIGSVAVFNDVIRDGLKGSTFQLTSTGYINGNPFDNSGKIQFSIRGGKGTGGAGWTVNDAMIINYMSAHDNNTLWDKLSIANGAYKLEDRLAMNRLGATILFISKGTPFVQAGEEMLRTKPKYDKDGNLVYDEKGNITYDENSYSSSDETNNIKWDTLKEGSAEYEMMKYYAGLAQMRKAYDIFSNLNVEVTFEKLGAAGIIVKMKNHSNGDEALVLINPMSSQATYTLDGTWNLVADGTNAGSEVLATESGSVIVNGFAAKVYVR